MTGATVVLSVSVTNTATLPVGYRIRRNGSTLPTTFPGAFLVLTGVKLLLQRETELHPERNPLFRAFARWIPSVPEYHGPAFVVRRDGRLLATPLFLVLLCVEISDLIFAVDSIPAIFAVTKDPFIVFTSNIFAILGLRAMYFLLADVMDRFVYLKPGLAAVLMFVGAKMMIADVYKIPVAVSLAVVAGILALAVVTSLIATRRPEATAAAVPADSALPVDPGRS